MCDCSLEWLDELMGAHGRRRALDGLVWLQSVYAGAAACVSKDGAKAFEKLAKEFERAAKG